VPSKKSDHKPKPKSTGHGGAGRGQGRHPGSPNKSTQEIKALTRSVVDFKQLLLVFKREATKPKTEFNHVSYLCGVKLFEYGFGKPPQQLSIKDGDDKTLYEIVFGDADKEN
jgi:hypothetical protein